MLFVSFTFVGAGIVFLVLAGLLARAASNRNNARRISELREFLDLAVFRAVLNFDRDQVFAAVVPVVLFVALPGAALLNTLLGGSPALLNCYLLIAGSILAHMLLAERPGWSFFTAVLSGVGAVMALVVLPYYAIWSLTSHMLKGFPAEGALAGIFIALILYSANAGAWTLLHARPNSAVDGGVRRYAGCVLMALPVGYVLYWFVVLASQVAGGEYSDFMGWVPLVVFTAGFAVTASSVQAIVDFGRRKGDQLNSSALWSAGLGILAISAGFAIH